MQEEFQDTKIAIRIRKSTNRQTIQCPKEKGQIMIYKTKHKNLRKVHF
jgi:hypothetical protein